MNPDTQLIYYVNSLINTGATKIEIPAELIQNASANAILEVKRMCKLNRVEITNMSL